MNTDSIKDQLWSLFQKSKKDRHRFLSNYISSNIASQIFSMRTSEDRSWTQTKLAEEAEIPQPRIPLLENPDYGKFTLLTLKKLAWAFDVALIVKFVPFRDLIEQIEDVSPMGLDVPSFDKEKDNYRRFKPTTFYRPDISLGKGTESRALEFVGGGGEPHLPRLERQTFIECKVAGK